MSQTSPTSIELDLAELAFLQTHLAQRAKICFAMIAAGIICLIAGVVMLVVGLTGEQVVWFESGNVKVTAGGFGAVTMVASVAWGYVAYRSRPVLKMRDRDRSRNRDRDIQLRAMTENELKIERNS